MKKVFFSAALLLSLYCLGQNKTVAIMQESSPSTAGVSADRLNRLDQFIQSYIDQNKLNGAVGIIVRDGKIVYHKALGYYDVQSKVPMKKDNIFRIASMTKPIVSVAAMILYEEGKFLLDDPVSKYIPEFNNPKVLDKYNAADTTYTTVPAKTEITVRQLLTHTSGIGYAQTGTDQAKAIYYKNGISGGIAAPFSTLKEMIPKLAKLPLFNQPGEKFLYGLSVDVLGYLVEVISGIPLDKFLQQRIFGPLGMKDTYFFLPKEKHSRLVKLYLQDSTGIRLQDSIISLNGICYRDFPNMANGTYFSGGAGLSSTAYDYAIFCQMLSQDGEYNGVRILSPHAIRLMTSNQIGEIPIAGPRAAQRFGLGFGIYTEKTALDYPLSVGSYEWGGLYATSFWIDPKAKLVAVFMRNVWPSREPDFRDRLKPLVYQALTY